MSQPECMEETTQRFDLHSVMAAPNFLPGLALRRYTNLESKRFDQVIRITLLTKR